MIITTEYFNDDLFNRLGSYLGFDMSNKSRIWARFEHNDNYNILVFNDCNSTVGTKKIIRGDREHTINLYNSLYIFNLDTLKPTKKSPLQLIPSVELIKEIRDIYLSIINDD